MEQPVCILLHKKRIPLTNVARSRSLQQEVLVVIPLLSTGAARINNKLKFLVAALNVKFW